MRIFRILLFVFAGTILVLLAAAGHYYYKGFYGSGFKSHSRTLSLSRITAEESVRIKEKAALLRPYLAAGSCNRKICFMADMRLPSGRNRFFVYDLSKDSIVLSGLVAHGCGNSVFRLSPEFSNVNGSNCTALGRYKIGQPYQGQFGLAYKLFGLDPTNDQAFNRNIVLHAYTAVPEKETAPYPICNSRGCPMVAPLFLQRLRVIIDGASQPVILWIFN